MTLAKGIGGGFPLGACLASAEAARGMTVGTHGSTFGGNPLAMAVGCAVIDIVSEPAFLEDVRRKGLYLKQRLASVVDAHPSIASEVRGEGLLAGIRCIVPVGDVVTAARDAGRWRCAGENVVRLLPPLVSAKPRSTGDRASRCGARVHRGSGPRPPRQPREWRDGQAFSRHRRLRYRDPRAILADAGALKAARRRPDAPRPLAGKTLALIFDKPSTRTRVSFDVAMRELGGETVVLTGGELQIGRGETVADTAKVLSRYVDAIMIRILDHGMLAELAANATIPVINGLTRRSHPCQVMADVMTFEEHKGPISGRTIAWLGDGNNVLTSWVQAAVRLGFRLRVATPPELAPRAELIKWARENGGDVIAGDDPEETAAGADCVVTDTFVSMGDAEAERRHNLLMPYQVNARLMDRARSDAIFMHCLPAHRGGGDRGRDRRPQSVVFDEAENRLHAQKAILLWALAPGSSRGRAIQMGPALDSSSRHDYPAPVSGCWLRRSSWPSCSDRR